ncbi:helix-turn-helix transcriptional regulator [Aneurinibacillus aneurinilyticus]|uniref:helix-turn-helix domain-containing protein n=1 Tax=Aneurinibacillus aneurinilyticus TaxID=1391 RepID=UPI002E227EBF|nr:helix-turn-helix transcriptional regulator [Aneurinibacillus aneurinilyticus]
MDFGERLSDLRTKNKLTQQELSNRLNIAKSTLAMYETGKREPGFETLQRIADFFETSIDYLLGRTDEPSPTHKASNDESDGLAFIDGKGPITEEEKEYLKESLELFRRMKAKKKE